MTAPPWQDGAEQDADHGDGVWLTDREPGELLGPRRVVVHLRDSESIVIGEVSDRDEAITLAEQLLDKIDRAAARGDWAELDDHLVQPDSIVSVDVELVE
jgi:hypothetical protein